MCVCVQECPFDLFGLVFLVHVSMYGSYCATGLGTCMGMAMGLVSYSKRWFLLMLDHVSYTLQRLWLSFQTPHQMISQTETARQCYKLFTLQVYQV